MDVGDYKHCCRVDEVVFELDLRIFALQCLGHDFPPQTRARQDVRLVYRVYRKRRVARNSNLRRHTRDALDLLYTIDHCVPRDVLLRRDALFFTLAKVDAADEFADDDYVDASGDGILQRRVDYERV